MLCAINERVVNWPNSWRAAC